MSQLTVTLPDGSTKSVPHATTLGDIAASISPRLAQAAYAGMVNGRVVDLAHPLQEDAHVRILTNKDPEALTVYRHSTAHLLAPTTGFSLSYVRKGRSLGRMDVGFGGGEGVQLFWSFGVFRE